MAPHLVRAESAYKDIRIHSFHHTRTHTHTHARTHARTYARTHTPNTGDRLGLWRNGVKFSEDVMWLSMRRCKSLNNDIHANTKFDYPMECFGQCTVTYTGYPQERSDRDHRNNNSNEIATAWSRIRCLHQAATPPSHWHYSDADVVRVCVLPSSER